MKIMCCSVAGAEDVEWAGPSGVVQEYIQGICDMRW
jgi:hypothetical protein